MTDPLRAALTELVACHEFKEMDWLTNDEKIEIRRRFPAAWEAARAALAPHTAAPEDDGADLTTAYMAGKYDGRKEAERTAAQAVPALWAREGDGRLAAWGEYPDTRYERSSIFNVPLYRAAPVQAEAPTEPSGSVHPAGLAPAPSSTSTPSNTGASRLHTRRD